MVLAGGVQHSPTSCSCRVGEPALAQLRTTAGHGKGAYCDDGRGRVGGQVLTSQDEGTGPVN